MNKGICEKVIVALETHAPDRPLLEFLEGWCAVHEIREIIFLHVLPKPVHVTGKEHYWESDLKELDAAAVRKLEKELEGYFHPKSPITTRFALREGNPLEEILKEVALEKPDLLVAGTRKEGPHHVLIQNIIRKVSCNVLVVPEACRSRSAQTILVPVDFSPHSVTAFQTAIQLGKEQAARPTLKVGHVFSMPDFSVYRISRSPAELKEMIEASHKDAFRAFIHQYSSDYPMAQITWFLKEKEKPGIAHYILEMAEEADADLIVIGAKGHSRVELLLLGSVTEQFLAINKRFPVLVVQEKKD